MSVNKKNLKSNANSYNEARFEDDEVSSGFEADDELSPTYRDLMRMEKMGHSWKPRSSVKHGKPCTSNGSFILKSYQIHEKLGSGSDGKVFRCLDWRLNKFFAVKILKDAAITEQQYEFNLVRFLRKKNLELYNQLIVKMEGYHFEGQFPCIIMELLGKNLHKVISENGSLPIADVRIISKQISKALAFIHQYKIVHADVKPENIALVANSKTWVKLLDFGISFIEGNHETYQLQTEPFRSPDVFLKDEITTKIDVWSLGCTCLMLSSGRLIFNEDSDKEYMAAMLNVLKQDPTAVIERSQRGRELFRKVKGRYIIRGRRNPRLGKYPALSFYVGNANFDENYPKEDVFEDMLDMIRSTLQFDYLKRTSAKDLLDHPFLKSVEE